KVILSRLGWLDAPRWLEGKVRELTSFAAEVRGEGFTRVLLLGMGGSSLAPEVLAEVLHPSPGAPTLEVLDSTDPAALRDAGAAGGARRKRRPASTGPSFWSPASPAGRSRRSPSTATSARASRRCAWSAWGIGSPR